MNKKSICYLDPELYMHRGHKKLTWSKTPLDNLLTYYCMVCAPFNYKQIKIIFINK